VLIPYANTLFDLRRMHAVILPLAATVWFKPSLNGGGFSCVHLIYVGLVLLPDRGG
jgi:hypothetical protein